MTRTRLIVFALLLAMLTPHVARAQESTDSPDISILREQVTPPPVSLQDANEGSRLAAKEEPFIPSYGTWEKSIMFSGHEIEDFRRVIDAFEQKRSGHTRRTPETVGEIVEQIETASQVENVIYPSFQLRTLIYKNPNDWYLYLNTAAFSSLKPTTEGEIRILGVNREFVNFMWIPTDPTLFLYIVTNREDLAKDSLEQPDAALATPPFHNRLANKPLESFINTSERGIVFSLRPNQTFDSETFNTYEGLPQGLHAWDPKNPLPPLQNGSGDNADGKANEPLLPGGTAPDSGIDEMLRGFSVEKTNPKDQIRRALGKEE